MDLNYFAFFLISFIPLIVGFLWYNSKFPLFKQAVHREHLPSLAASRIFIVLVLSAMFVYVYMNLIIHQMGFYELFFTDIMKGSEEAVAITEEFLATYGQKHRHFGHGIFHGAINAFFIGLPIIGGMAILGQRSKKFVLDHFGYFLLTSIIVGGLISEFV